MNLLMKVSGDICETWKLFSDEMYWMMLICLYLIRTRRNKMEKLWTFFDWAYTSFGKMNIFLKDLLVIIWWTDYWRLSTKNIWWENVVCKKFCFEFVRIDILKRQQPSSVKVNFTYFTLSDLNSLLKFPLNI
jgi:hypothetical protein